MQAQMFVPSPRGDQNKGWALVAVCWSLVLCALISTILRLHVRARLTKNLGRDDIVIAIAMVLTIVGAGFITAEVVNGLGRHMYYLTDSQRTNFKGVEWADWVQVFITLGLTKISICLFLLRIVDSKNVVRGMWALIGFTALFSSVCVFLFLGICRPLNAYWIIGKNGKCFSKSQVEGIIIAQGVLSIATDLICALLPAIFLRNLQINKRTKIGLCILMGLGMITAVCCTVRTGLSGENKESDATWATVPNVGWRLPEVNIGIFCANLPIVRPLYLFFRGRLQSQRTAAAASNASKERIWPNNAKRVDNLHLKPSSSWHHTSGDPALEVEMGLPIHQTPPLGEGPLKGKPYFSLGSGRR